MSCQPRKRKNTKAERKSPSSDRKGIFEKLETSDESPATRPRNVLEKRNRPGSRVLD
jgi:hypothetical protein